MPTCPNGHTVAPDNAFCYQCGATIADGQTVVRPTVLSDDDTTERPAVRLAPEPTPLLVEMGGYEPFRERRNHNAIIYSIAGLVILVAIGGALAALLLNSADSKNNAGQTTNPTIGTSPTSKAPMPAGGTLCPGLILGKYQFGTFGTNTSCGFVRSVYQAWESSGNQSPVTATSPSTHETYSNIVCTVDATQSWATCVGGRNNSAKMFFALP